MPVVDRDNKLYTKSKIIKKIINYINYECNSNKKEEAMIRKTKRRIDIRKERDRRRGEGVEEGGKFVSFSFLQTPQFPKRKEHIAFDILLSRIIIAFLYCNKTV